MSAITTGQTPAEYLDAAERCFANNDPLTASHLLWKAAEATFHSLAERNGLDSGNLSELARALDRRQKRNYYYLGNLSTAYGLQHHAELDIMEPYEVADSRAAVRRFVRQAT